jgi:hypothetical protein
LDREWDIVCLAREGNPTVSPVLQSLRSPSLVSTRTSGQAVEHILGSRDFVTLFRGGAGTGKSYALREVRNGLRRRASLQVIAPQRQQVIDLERDGMTALRP